jgi:hypothetical protein
MAPVSCEDSGDSAAFGSRRATCALIWTPWEMTTPRAFDHRRVLAEETKTYCRLAVERDMPLRDGPLAAQAGCQQVNSQEDSRGVA